MTNDDVPTLMPTRLGIGTWQTPQGRGTLLRLTCVGPEGQFKLDVALNEQMAETLALELLFQAKAAGERG